MLSALVEEAVTTGDLVRLMTFKKSTTTLSEFTLPDDSRLAGVRVRDIAFPGDAVLVAILRDGLPLTPERDRAFEGGDELLFIVTHDSEDDLADMLADEPEAEEG
jgi:trk system potassium uptake protein TrkA